MRVISRAGSLPGKALRREVESWSALTHLRFEQDTADEAAKAAKEYRDELAPTATHHEVALKRRLLAHPDRAAVAAITGAHALRLWETDITTFAPEIEEDLQAEAKLYSRYTALMASAKIEIEGQVVNLSGLAPFLQSLDRDCAAPRRGRAFGVFRDATPPRSTRFTMIW